VGRAGPIGVSFRSPRRASWAGCNLDNRGRRHDWGGVRARRPRPGVDGRGLRRLSDRDFAAMPAIRIFPAAVRL